MTAATLQLDDINKTRQIACGLRLDRTFHWLFKRNKKRDPNDLFLGAARHWQSIKATLRARLLRGDYTLELRLKISPAKTWLGRVSKGSMFLGYQISLGGIRIAQGSVSRLMTKLHRQNAQGTTKNSLVDYVKRWLLWV